MTAPTTTPKTTAKADVTKTGDTVTASGRFTVKNLPTLDLDEARKPLFAVVGVADYAIEQVRTVSAELPTRYAAEAQKAQEKLAEVPTVVKTLPEQVQTFRNELETRVAKATEQANDFYAQLAVRGERLVTSIRRQPATEAAIAEGKEAVRKAEAAANAAKKSAKAGEKAVEDAATKVG
jgi:hypothetical protein